MMMLFETLDGGQVNKKKKKYVLSRSYRNIYYIKKEILEVIYDNEDLRLLLDYLEKLR